MIRKWELNDGRIMQIEQDLDIVNKEFGAIVWDCALVLSKYLENEKVFPKGFFKGKTILDLGSGTGFIGILLMIKGATVHFTDRQVLIPLIEKNIDLNCKVESEIDDSDGHDENIDEKASILASQFKCFEYLWGEANEIVDATHYDFVIGCDCIYESKDMWMPLSKALNNQLSSSENIILAHELRSQKDFSFWPHIQETFDVERVPSELLDEFWKCDAIRIFYLTFKGQSGSSTTTTAAVAVDKVQQEQEEEAKQ